MPGVFRTINPAGDRGFPGAGCRRAGGRARGRARTGIGGRRAARLVKGADSVWKPSCGWPRIRCWCGAAGWRIPRCQTPSSPVTRGLAIGGAIRSIALPGLAWQQGRTDVARAILVAYARFVDQGMVPNRWPDAGDAPEYTSVDAALWFLHSLEAYVDARATPRSWRAWAPRSWTSWIGTCGARVTGSTWTRTTGCSPPRRRSPTHLDGRQVGDWVVTPRRGKPVEINALWWRGLTFAVRTLEHLQWDAADTRRLADRAAASFAGRFWNPDTGSLYDIVDGPAGDDPSIGPTKSSRWRWAPTCCRPPAPRRRLRWWSASW